MIQMDETWERKTITVSRGTKSSLARVAEPFMVNLTREMTIGIMLASWNGHHGAGRGETGAVLALLDVMAIVLGKMRVLCGPEGYKPDKAMIMRSLDRYISITEKAAETIADMLFPRLKSRSGDSLPGSCASLENAAMAHAEKTRGFRNG